MSDVRLEALRTAFRADRFLAHRKLFAHRHEYPFAPFHRQLVEDFWSADWRHVTLGFRESGKTTLVEEAITIAACEGAFRNCVIIGAKEALAAELLTNVRVELEQNEDLRALWPEVAGKRGAIWATTKLELADGRCIQALGRDQSLRGTKHRDWRPDLVVINDFEDDEELLSAEGRRRTLRWVLRVLLPACDRARRRVRIYDTLRDADSVPMTLIRRQGWPHRLVPVSFVGGDGEEYSSWPGHPTLTMDWIRKERNAYFALGEGDIWEREMAMDISQKGDRTFSLEQIRIEPRERSWQPVYVMIDPARRARGGAAFTGWAAWSWLGNRLHVWEAGAVHLLPDEIVDLAFRLAAAYDPVEVGVEKDGLAEWMEQPMRQRMVREGFYLPFRAVSAPRSGDGQASFIAGLQPFFAAGEITWQQEFPALREQMENFPRGRRDALNALAYAVQLRPGRLVYEDFRPEYIRPELLPSPWQPVYLAANARDRWVTGALVQVVDGRVSVIADWAFEGMPDERVADLAQQAMLMNTTRRYVAAPLPANLAEALKLPDDRVFAARRELSWILPESHFDRWLNIGLQQAVTRLPAHAGRGGGIAEGREWLRHAIGASAHGEAAFQVSETARWTCRALAGGYQREWRDAEPRSGPYRSLMEGLEAWAALLALGHFGEEEEETAVNWRYNRAGQRYVSCIPERRH